MGIKTMVHLNHHLMCACDIETTGLVPDYHEIIQIAFVPLDNRLELHPDHQIFEFYVKPFHLDRVDSDIPMGMRHNIKKAAQIGYEPDVVLDLFEEWFKGLRLPERKRLIPLAFNYQFDIGFLQRWMGYENYQKYFDSRTRDLQTVIHYMNDRADWNGQEYPFQKERLSLREVVKLCGVPLDENRLHDAVYDSYITAQAYKKVCLEVFV